MEFSDKYGRTLHAGFSLGTTSDDRFMPEGYVKIFSEMEDLILTEKLDGQNDSINRKGVFARSHVSFSNHPWDKPIWNRWELIKNDLGNLELFGENMYATHSIGYKNLESYYYIFAIREGKRWLSWEEVKFYAALLDFPTVPEIPLKDRSLKSFFQKGQSEEEALYNWITYNLGMSWHEYTDTSGMLGGYDTQNFDAACEGLVLRNSAEYFRSGNNSLIVADNEFDSLVKLVRKGHVTTDAHWTKSWKEAPLANYEKYNWQEYSYLSKKQRGNKKEIREKFRNDVFKRDEYTCRKCKKKTEKLDAHHITDRNEAPNGGYIKENGISLCEACHEKAEKFHSTGRAIKGYTPEDLYSLIGSSKELVYNIAKNEYE
jgi:hypothetical protein